MKPDNSRPRLRAETQKLVDALKDDPQLIHSVVQIGSDGFVVCYKRQSGEK